MLKIISLNLIDKLELYIDTNLFLQNRNLSANAIPSTGHENILGIKSIIKYYIDYCKSKASKKFVESLENSLCLEFKPELLDPVLFNPESFLIVPLKIWRHAVYAIIQKRTQAGEGFSVIIANSHPKLPQIKKFYFKKEEPLKKLFKKKYLNTFSAWNHFGKKAEHVTELPYFSEKQKIGNCFFEQLQFALSIIYTHTPGNVYKSIQEQSFYRNKKELKKINIKSFKDYLAEKILAKYQNTDQIKFLEQKEKIHQNNLIYPVRNKNDKIRQVSINEVLYQ